MSDRRRGNIPAWAGARPPGRAKGDPAIAGLPLGQILVVLAAAAVFLGWGHRVLDRMRLTDTTALILLVLLFLAPLVPDVPVGAGLRVDLAGTLVPVGIAVYLIATADRAYEQRRAVVAALVVGAAVFALDALLPPEPGMMGRLDVDPIYLNGLLAGVVGYLAGRSRRAAFIAGVLGVFLADLGAALLNLARGVSGPLAALGGAGAFDATVVAGFLAVLLAEVVGESREYLARTGGGEAPGPEGGGSARGDGAAGEPRQAPGGAAGTLALALALVLAAGSAALGDRVWASRWGDELPPEEADRGLHFRLVDESDREVTVLGWRVFPGDGYIDERNRSWRVERVVGRRAVVSLLGTVELLAPDPEADRAARAAEARAARAGLLDVLLGRPAAGGRHILVLHTHNDESYVKGDGTALIEGRGGIHEVGEDLAAQLRARGYKVTHDQSLHLPHDRSAYRRSRRTILQYLDERPILVADVHRDVVPPSFYADEAGGRGITRVRIVVGRQNPTRAANLQEAKRLKAVADGIHPGYVRGIFMGRGNYNQDLGPRVLLFEVGAHSNARASAERSTAILAEAVDRYLRQFGDVR